MKRILDYTVLDVFAERALEGNPLAVFHDARGLSTEQMQALARETNLSESTFVFPADDPEQDRSEGVRVRIFTTREELPFAGHPTLGTASWLQMHHPALRDAHELTLRLNVGPIPVIFAPGGSAEGGVFATMRQNDPIFRDKFSCAEVAGLLGLSEADLMPGYKPQSVSTGNAFCIVALNDVATLERLAIPPRESSAWLSERGIRWFYVLAPVNREEAHWRARMQFYGGEDPATGSAAGPAIAWLVRNGLVQADANALFEQGVEIHRPSAITACASYDGDRVYRIDISGRTIPVAQGRYFLP
jgi:trans-2,3-dihydro-3-hydroxyanthranilate isomerase